MKPLSLRGGATCAALCVLASSWMHGSVRAGDRELNVVFTDMTPDAVSDDASRSCAKRVLAELRAGYTVVQPMGERKLLGFVGDQGSAEFMSWSDSALTSVREREAFWADAAVLMDCRPTQQRADVLIAPASGGVTRLRLRGAAIDDARMRMVARVILHHAWVGFSP